MFKEPNVEMIKTKNKKQNRDGVWTSVPLGSSLTMAVAESSTTHLPAAASPHPPLNMTAYINRVLREKIPAISH